MKVSLLQLPQNIWRDNVVYFLPKIEDLVRLDSAVTNRTNRAVFHANIRGCRNFTIFCTKVRSGKLKWLIMHNMYPHSVEFSEEPNCDDMLYIQQLLTRLRTIQFTKTSLHSNNLLQTTCSSTLTCLIFESSTVEDISAIASCSNLTCLCLFHCRNVTDESLSLGITGCVKLEQCYLHNCTKLRAPSIAAVLTHCVVLEDLNIGGVFRLQQVFSQFNSVSKLTMFECVDSYRKRQLTGETIQAMAAALPDLTRLKLNYNYNSVTDGDIDVLVRSCQSLTSLTMCGFVGITDGALSSIADDLPALQTISVDNCTRVTDVGVIALSYSLTSLYSLSLQNLSITNAAVKAVGTNCRALKLLNVNECSLLTDDAFLTLNMTCLINLDISGTRVTGSFAAHVLSDTSTLYALSCFACENLDATFVQSFTTSSTLSTLGLGNNRLSASDWLLLSTKVPHLWTLIIRNYTFVNDTVEQSFRANCPRLHNVAIRP